MMDPTKQEKMTKEFIHMLESYNKKMSEIDEIREIAYKVYKREIDALVNETGTVDRDLAEFLSEILNLNLLGVEVE